MAIKVDFALLKDLTTANISFDGVLENDEKALSALHIPDAAEIHLHLGQLSRINSLGVRSFINWISPLANERIVIYDAPKCFIDQLNMVDGFLPSRARIRSFYVPYYSEETSEETQVLFSIGLNFYLYEGHWKFSFPEIYDSRGNLMSVDIQPERYFKFLERMK